MSLRLNHSLRDRFVLGIVATAMIVGGFIFMNPSAPVAKPTDIISTDVPEAYRERPGHFTRPRISLYEYGFLVDGDWYVAPLIRRSYLREENSYRHESLGAIAVNLRTGTSRLLQVNRESLELRGHQVLRVYPLGSDSVALLAGKSSKVRNLKYDLPVSEPNGTVG